MKKNPQSFSDLLSDKKFKKYYDGASVVLSFGAEVFYKRKTLKISQQVLAKRAETTQKIISKIENGEINPGLDLVARISKKLELDSGVFARIFGTPICLPYEFTAPKASTESSNIIDVSCDYKLS